MTCLHSFLSSVNWKIKIVVLIVTSLLATILPLPIPIADIAFLGTLGHFNSIWWVLGIALLITVTDTLFAMVTYKLSHKLSRVIVRNESKRKKLEEINGKLRKQAPFWLFIAGMTPFPFTLTIYAAATLKYDFKKFTIIMLTSRFVKYIVMGVLFYLGYSLII